MPPTPRKTAPAKKTATKKVTPQPIDPDSVDIVIKIKSLLDKVQRVLINQVSAHPKNPRQGNVQKVADSLRTNGMYKPIVVQQSTSYILAGNHTWLAARKLGWTHIDAVFIDVGEEAATRILLADNKTSDDSTYDDAALAEALASIATTEIGLEGSGFDPAELQDLIDSVGKHVEQSGTSLDELMANMPKTEMREASRREQYEEERAAVAPEEIREAKSARGAAKQDKAAEMITEDDDVRDGEVELQAVLEIKVNNVDFWKQIGREGGDDFEIPPLRDDMLLEELPTPLGTWAGHDVTPDDGEKWFLYNYGLGGIKGLPYDRSILCFYTHDEKFAGWWETPEWYTARAVHRGVRIAVLPDFSFYYTQPRIVHLMNVYRSVWLGRFFQEAGMKVIPRLQFDYKDPDTLDIALRQIPRGCPILATSQQNVEDEKTNGPKVAKILQEALDEIKPAQLLYYSGPGGKRVMETVNYDGEVVYLENYVALRREVAFGKKEGLAGVKKPDRQKLLKNARARILAASQTTEEVEDTEEE